MGRSAKKSPSSAPPIGRRELLGSAALAGAALLGCGHKKDPYRIDKPALRNSRGWRPGEERCVLSTCALCEAGCGIKVRVVEGRAVKIEGNPEHPVNRGGLCSRGQAGLQLLYHPERVRSPLRRMGARGEGQWKPISWDEAIGEVVAKLAQLRAAGRPERLVMIDGEPGGFTYELWTRFLTAFGSPNAIELESPSQAVDLAAQYMQGGQPAYDLDRTRFVLAMGTELLESSGQAMHFWRAAGAPAENGLGRRLRLACVSPRRPRFRVDEWIPITPGSYGALALSLAHVLIRDGLTDKEFVRDHIFGFAPWTDPRGIQQQGFEQLVRAEFGPEKTAQLTGIPASTVERLGHELAEKQPAVAAGAGDAAAASNGLASAAAIFALNALLGNLERAGGVLLQRQASLADWGSIEYDEVSKQGLMKPRIDGVGRAACPLRRACMQAVPAAITQAKPYPVEILLFHQADPLYALPGGQAWTAALHKVPLVVSFSSLLDDTTQLADLVLPEHLPLEAWDVVKPAPATGDPLLGFRQPVIAPVHDTRPAGDVILAFAARLSGSISRSLPWKNYEDAVMVRLKGLLKPSEDGDAAEDGKSLLADMKEKGGWWPESAKAEARTPIFPTPSRRFDLASMTAESQGLWNRAAQDALSGLPPWEPARFSGAPVEFPFQLLPYRPISFVSGSPGSFPWLNELPIVSGNPWPDRAEINPGDAAQLGLADGDRVLVTSPAGTCEAVLQLSDGVRPGVVAMALGKGDVINLVVPDEDKLSGLLAWQGTRVRLRKMS